LQITLADLRSMAYADKVHSGRGTAVASEANRQKGTLQIKVQIETPDQLLTPAPRAKVQFFEAGEHDR
jgi:hypothetical protein